MMKARFSASFAVAPVLAALLLGAAGCGDDGVSSDEDAERAYKGLDASIDKAIQLGFDGFNAASNATIPPQTAQGAVSGTMTISGKVDQGASDNKTMNLVEKLQQYADQEKLTYDTDDAALPILDMKLSKIPDGTVDGTFAGKFGISGDLEGFVTLNITFTSALEPTPADDTKVQRKPGSTHITGTADSDYGTYQVDLTR